MRETNDKRQTTNDRKTAPRPTRWSSVVRRKSGFTLVETLVAIAVLVTSIVGPLSIAAKGLAASLLARDQVTAFYLAQEGVEYVRGVRDENVLRGAGWLVGLKPQCTGGELCNVDSRNDALVECDLQCPVLTYDPQTGFYGGGTGSASRFRRTIAISEISPTEALVVATISWTSGLFPRTFSIREVITDWGSGTQGTATASTGNGSPPPPVYHTLAAATYIHFTLSNGNLQLNRSGAASNVYALFDSLPQTGKWYFEIYVDSYSGSPQPMVGIIGTDKNLGDSPFNQGGDGFMHNFQAEYYRNNASESTGAKNFGSGGSVIAIAYDADGKRAWVGGRTGPSGAFSWVNPGGAAPDPGGGVNPFHTASGATGARRLAMSNTNNGGSWQITYNFGQGSVPGTTFWPAGNGSFVFQPPVGFTAITN